MESNESMDFAGHITLANKIACNFRTFVFFKTPLPCRIQVSVSPHHAPRKQIPANDKQFFSPFLKSMAKIVQLSQCDLDVSAVIHG